MILFSLSVSHRVFYNLTVKTRPITVKENSPRQVLSSIFALTNNRLKKDAEAQLLNTNMEENVD